MGRKRHVVSPRLPQGQVAIGVAESDRLGQIEEAEPRIGKPADDGQGVVGTPISDDEKFEVGLGLLQDRLNRQPQHIAPVVRRQKNRKLRPRGSHPPRTPTGNEYGISGVSIGSRHLSGSLWS